MSTQTLNEIYPDNERRPHANDPAKRLEYMEQVMKHIMALAIAHGKPERIRQSAEEALGWRIPFETEFALPQHYRDAINNLRDHAEIAAAHKLGEDILSHLKGSHVEPFGGRTGSHDNR